MKVVTPPSSSAPWPAVPAWRVLQPVKEQGYPSLALLSVYRDHGVIQKDSRDDNHNRAGEDLSVYQRVLPGDVVINKMKAWQGSIGVSRRLGIVSPDYQVLRPRGSAFDATFLHYLLRSPRHISNYARLACGIRPDQWRLMWSEFRSISLELPPLDWQIAIGAFLDRRMSALDVLIAKKERLIALLQEKRQALITEAVTKGLDPNVPMKDSGVEWLGPIPHDWSVLPLRRLLLGIEQGWSPESEDRPADDGHWAVLKLSAVHKGAFRPSEQKALPEGVNPERRYEVRPGDLLLTRANTPLLVGDTCCVRTTPPRLMLPDLIYRLKVATRRVLPSYLARCLLSAYGRGQITSDARGSSMTMAKVSGGHIRTWIVALPNRLEEQEAIVKMLDLESGKTDELVRKIAVHIEQLREYRQALISAAVTGKLDLSKEPS